MTFKTSQEEGSGVLGAMEGLVLPQSSYRPSRQMPHTNCKMPVKSMFILPLFSVCTKQAAFRRETANP